MAGNGWKKLERAGNGCLLEMASNGQKWLQMSLNGWKLLEIAENRYTCQLVVTIV